MEIDLKKLVQELKVQLNGVVDKLVEVTASLTSNRPSHQGISAIKINAYGQVMSLSAIATFVFESSYVVVINLFDKGIKEEVLSSLHKLNLSAQIQDLPSGFRLTFLPLTEEVKKERHKELMRILENSRAQIRQLRQSYNSKVKELKLREDDEKSIIEDIQKVINEVNDRIEQIGQEKKSELLN